MFRRTERFWIAFILRFAFGFLFLFAAVGIFSYGPSNFSADLAKPFETTWVGGIPESSEFIKKFLLGVPYAMGILSVPILTGIFLRPALRLGALLLVCLGLGKYIQNDTANMASNFTLAFIMCLGLYALDRDPADEPMADYGA